MNDLRLVDVLGGEVRLAGIIDLESTPGGIVLHRMPAWARTQHNDPALTLLETMPAGARIEMTTEATTLALEVQVTMVQLGKTPGPAAAFDLIVDGRIISEQTTRIGTLIIIDAQTRATEFQPGPSTTIMFENLPAGSKHVEIWLPHAAAVHLISLRADGSVTPPTRGTAPKWVHYGSSISHCLEATRPTGAWPVVAARLANVDLQSFAFAGQCQLDPFAAGMIATQPADFISLKVGINIVNGDTMRERVFVPAIHGFLDTVRKGHPEVPIILITPIICPTAEDRPGPTVLGEDGNFAAIARSPELSSGSLTLRRIRDLEAAIVTARQRAGDSNLHLLDGTELFGTDDLDDLPDGLHPNAAGYRRMGQRFHSLAFQQGPFKAK